MAAQKIIFPPRVEIHIDKCPRAWPWRRPAEVSPGENWDEVHADYVKAFGPEASTIGPPEGPEGTA